MTCIKRNKKKSSAMVNIMALDFGENKSLRVFKNQMLRMQTVHLFPRKSDVIWLEAHKQNVKFIVSIELLYFFVFDCIQLFLGKPRFFYQVLLYIRD